MSEKPNRAPNTSWTMRRPGTYPNGYVTTQEGDRVQVAYLWSPNGPAAAFDLSRADARLLARRINQCLDETRKP